MVRVRHSWLELSMFMPVFTHLCYTCAWDLRSQIVIIKPSCKTTGFCADLYFCNTNYVSPDILPASHSSTTQSCIHPAIQVSNKHLWSTCFGPVTMLSTVFFRCLTAILYPPWFYPHRNKINKDPNWLNKTVAASQVLGTEGKGPTFCWAPDTCHFHKSCLRKSSQPLCRIDIFIPILQIGKSKFRGVPWFVKVKELVSGRIIFQPRSAIVNMGPFPSLLCSRSSPSRLCPSFGECWGRSL